MSLMCAAIVSSLDLGSPRQSQAPNSYLQIRNLLKNTNTALDHQTDKHLPRSFVTAYRDHAAYLQTIRLHTLGHQAK
jgi:hypothetical protein